jgi:hypothetical protein
MTKLTVGSGRSTRTFALLPYNMEIVRLIEESGYVGKKVGELTDTKACAFMLGVVFASLRRTSRQRWWQVWRPPLTRAWLEEQVGVGEIPVLFARVCAETRARRRGEGEPQGEGARP